MLLPIALAKCCSSVAVFILTCEEKKKPCLCEWRKMQLEGGGIGDGIGDGAQVEMSSYLQDKWFQTPRRPDKFTALDVTRHSPVPYRESLSHKNAADTFQICSIGILKHCRWNTTVQIPTRILYFTLLITALYQILYKGVKCEEIKYQDTS